MLHPRLLTTLCCLALLTAVPTAMAVAAEAATAAPETAEPEVAEVADPADPSDAAWARFLADPHHEAGRVAGYECLLARFALAGSELAVSVSDGETLPQLTVARRRLAAFTKEVVEQDDGENAEDWRQAARQLDKRLKLLLGGMRPATDSTIILPGLSPALPLPPGTGVRWRLYRCTPDDAHGLLAAVWGGPLVPGRDDQALVDSGRSQVDRLSMPGPGFYRIEAEDDQVLALRQALVGDLAAVIAVEPRQGQVLALIADRAGHPLVAAEVAVRLEVTGTASGRQYWRGRYHEDAENDSRSNIAGGSMEDGGALSDLTLSTRTDAGGLAVLPFPPAADGLGLRWRLAVHANPGDPHAALLAAAGEVTADRPRERDLAHLACDRPLYRGGETVQLRLILRRFRDGRELDHRGWQGRLRLSHDGATLAEVPVATGDFGTAAASVPLPAECATGVYRWSLLPPAPPAPADGTPAPADSSEIAGGIAFRIEDFRLDDVVLSASPDRRTYQQGEAAMVTVQARLRDGTPLVAANGTVRSRNTGLVATFATDGEGVAVISVPAASRAVPGRLVITVEDARRRPVETWCELPSGDGLPDDAPTLRLLCPQRLAAIADGVSVQLLSDQRKPLAVTLKLLRVSDGQRVPVASMAATLDDGHCDQRFPVTTPGLYEVRAEGRCRIASADEVATCEIVADRPRAGEADAPAATLRFDSGRRRYRIGEVAEVRLAGPANATALVVIEGRDQAETRVVRLVDGIGRLSLRLDAQHAPAVRLSATLAGAGSTTVRDAIAIEQITGLQVTVVPLDHDLAPGATTRCRVEVRDAEGRPVLGEIALGVVDEAIYDLEPEPWPRLEFPAPRPTARTATWHDEEPERDLALLQELFTRDDAGRMRLSGLRVAENAAGAFMAIGAGGGSAGIYGSRNGGGMRRALTSAGGSRGSETAPPTRRDFRVTAFWSPTVRSGVDGDAEVALTLPDSLTAWRITARVVAHDRRAGEARATIRTHQAVSLRADLPRLLRRGDRCDLQAVVVNDSDQQLGGTVVLTAAGLVVAKPGVAVTVAPRTQATVRFAVQVPTTGAEEATPLRLELKADGRDDTVELTLPLFAAGEPQRFAASGTAAAGTTAITVPALPGSGHQASLVLSPGPAGTLVAAARWLGGYPYGCVEQTMSRFMPALAVASGLERAGIEAAGIRSGLDERVNAGLARLASMRRNDGSWGWWSGMDGDLAMTAYVRLGLVEAAANGAVPARVGLDHLGTIDWRRWLGQPAVIATLRGEVLADDEDAVLEREEAMAGLRTALHVASVDRESLLLLAYADARAGLVTADALRPLLSAAAWPGSGERALVALTLDAGGDRDGARLALAQPLLPAAARPTGWLTDATVALAWNLRAAVALDPARADTLWRELAASRRDARWESTRHTAFALLAAADYLRLRPGQGAARSYAVRVAGAEVARGVFSAGRPLPAISLPATLARGATVEVISEGGACDYDLACSWRGKAAGPAPASPLTIARRYRVLRSGPFGEQVVGEPAAGFRAGERVRVELEVTSTQPLSHVLVADPRCPGLQPGLLRSDVRHEPADSVSVRDGELAFFFAALAPGRTIISYDAYGERSGVFHVPAAHAEAMYAPLISAAGTATDLTLAAADPTPPAASRITLEAEAFTRLVAGLTAALEAPGGGAHDGDLLRRLLALPGSAGSAYIDRGLPGCDPLAFADQALTDQVLTGWAGNLRQSSGDVAPAAAQLARMFALPASTPAISRAADLVLEAGRERRLVTATLLLDLALPLAAHDALLTGLADTLEPLAALGLQFDRPLRRDRLVLQRALLASSRSSVANLFSDFTWRNERGTWKAEVAAARCAPVLRLAAELPRRSGLERQRTWSLLERILPGLLKATEVKELTPELTAALNACAEAVAESLLSARLAASSQRERDLGDLALGNLVHSQRLPARTFATVLALPAGDDREHLLRLLLPGLTPMAWATWRDAVAGEASVVVRRTLGAHIPKADAGAVEAWRTWLEAAIRREGDEEVRRLLLVGLIADHPPAALILAEDPVLAALVIQVADRAGLDLHEREALQPLCRRLLASSDDAATLCAAWRFAPGSDLTPPRLLLLATCAREDAPDLHAFAAAQQLDPHVLWQVLERAGDHQLRWRLATLLAYAQGDVAWLAPLLAGEHELTRYAIAVLAGHGHQEAIARLADCYLAEPEAPARLALPLVAQRCADAALLRQWLVRADHLLLGQLISTAAQVIPADDLATLAADEAHTFQLLPALDRRGVMRPGLIAPLLRLAAAPDHRGSYHQDVIRLLLAGSTPAQLLPALGPAWAAATTSGRLLLLDQLRARREPAWMEWLAGLGEPRDPWLAAALARRLALCGGTMADGLRLTQEQRQQVLVHGDDGQVRTMLTAADPAWREAAAAVWFERHHERVPYSGAVGEARRFRPWDAGE